MKNGVAIGSLLLALGGLVLGACSSHSPSKSAAVEESAGACVVLQACCADLHGADAQSCGLVANQGVSTNCGAQLDAFQASGSCMGVSVTAPTPTHDGGTTTPTGACSEGQVVCPNGCADIENDVSNCGSCGYACPAGASGTAPSCSAGKCAYGCTGEGETLCPDPYGEGNSTCADLSSDRENCGACGNDCQNSAPEGTSSSCQNGSCQVSCPSGEGLCNNECINIETDPNNCGGCGTVCGANTVCTGGSCVAGCQDGGTLCSGACTSLQTDSNNCGTCGNACPLTASSCESGTCTCEVYCVDQFDSPYCCKGGQQCYENGCM
jgi:hypothetical protein